MNFRTKFYKPALVGLALLLFFGVSQMQNQLNQARKKLGFTRLAPLENAPPVLAFTTVALGGFRGLIANALWIRASDLQENEKYFEMVQLADWITKLEPHFVDVWRVQAWNMAYNISVKFKDHEDRWRWVQRGISLLRDDGLRYNPGETLLYRDLSWLFQHKMGQNLDDAHQLYKLRWAQEMQDVLGGHPNFTELLEPQTAEARARVKKLREVYKMDPEVVKEVDALYGPLDWRLPDAHAIYWAEMGRRSADEKDQETLRRSVYQSMQQACLRNGALPPHVTKITTNNFILGPNLELVEKVSAAYEKMIAEEPRIRQNMQTAHKNFLKQAIYLLYADAHPKKAAYWFKYMNDLYPNAMSGPDRGLTLDQYAVKQVTEAVGETDMNKVTAVLEGMAHNEFLSLIMNEDERAVNYHEWAQRVWNHYQDQIRGVAEARIKIKTMPELRQIVLDRLLDPANELLTPENIAILRTKLNLPAAGSSSNSGTNAPAMASPAQ